MTDCARQPTISIDRAGVGPLPAPVIERIRTIDDLKTVKALSAVDLTVQGKRRSFEIAFAAVMPDRVRIDLFDRVAGTFQSIVSVDSDERIEGLPWLPGEAIRILLGAPPFAIDLKGSYPFDSNGRFWVIPERGAVSWSAETGEMKYFEVKDGKLFAEIDYSDFKKDGKAIYPGRVVINIFRPRTTLKITFEDIIFNKAVDKKTGL